MAPPNKYAEYLVRVHPEVAGADPLHDLHGGVVLGVLQGEIQSKFRILVSDLSCG